MIIFILSVIGDNFRVYDFIIQILFLLIPIALLIGIAFLVVVFYKGNKRLEEKVDRLLADKKK